MPLEIYNQLNWVMKAVINPHAIIGNQNYQKKFFVDKGLQCLMKTFSGIQLDAVFLSGVSHKEIIELCRKYPERILITHDKYLLLNADIPNKIPYYSNEQVMTQLDKISVELFSSDSEKE